MHISLGNQHILLSFQVVLGGESVTSTHSFDIARGSFDVNYIPDCDLFLLQGLIDGRIQAQLFGALSGYQTQNDVTALAAILVFLLLRCYFSDFPFPHFLRFLSPQANCPSKVLH